MLYDITPLIDEDIAVWPGDTPFQARDLMRIEDGASVHLSTITLSCHTGAHADAPCHYVQDGPAIHEAPLEPFLGPCVVVDVDLDHGNDTDGKPTDGDASWAIRPADLDRGLAVLGCALQGAERILFRTGCTKSRTEFPDPLACFTPELVEHAAAHEIVLMGLDSPSVDRFDSKDLASHKALFAHRVAHLENLDLDGVPAGRYELIALPLKLRDRDASPVRAVLRTLD